MRTLHCVLAMLLACLVARGAASFALEEGSAQAATFLSRTSGRHRSVTYNITGD